MAKENIPEDFELYKLISLLKKNDYVIPEVSFVKIIILSFLSLLLLIHHINYISETYFILFILFLTSFLHKEILHVCEISLIN